MIDGFGVVRLEKSLGGAVAPWNESRAKRDKHGHFASVDSRVKQGGAAVNSLVHRGPADLNSVGDGIEDHPYIAAGVGLVMLRVAGKQGMQAWRLGKLVRAETDVMWKGPSYVNSAYKGITDFSITGAQSEDQFLFNWSARTAAKTKFNGTIPQKIKHARIKTGRVEMMEEGYRPTNRAGAQSSGAKSAVWNSYSKKTNGLYSPARLRGFEGGDYLSTLKNVEKSIKGNDYESAFVFVDGKLETGLRGYQTITPFVLPEGNLGGKVVTFTHNHPSFISSQSRSFSPGDFNVLLHIMKDGASKNSTLRAVYADGTTQELQVTNYRQFKDFNKIMQTAIERRYARQTPNSTKVDLEVLLETQMDIQTAALSGRHGFVIKQYDNFAKARVMSDAELRHRKRLQGQTSKVTGTLGLAALGGTLLATKTGSKATKAAFNTMKVARPGVLKPKQLKKATAPLLTTAAGIGGAGSFNSAAISNAESRKRRMTVMKSYEEPGMPEPDMPLMGEVSKLGDWKTIDQREQTQRRARKTMRHAGAAAGISGGLVALGYHDGGDKSKYRSMGGGLKQVNGLRQRGEFSNKDALKNGAKLISHGAKDLSATGKIGVAGLAGAAVAGSAAKAGHTYQQHKVNDRRRNNFKKSDTASAFGVEH